MTSLLTAATIGISLFIGSFEGGNLRPSTRAAAAEGREEARADIEAGDLILRTYGIATSGDSPYNRLLSERLGVKVRIVGGCTPSLKTIVETTAYNDVMEAEIRRRFGSNALAEIERDAKAATERSSIATP